MPGTAFIAPCASAVGVRMPPDNVNSVPAPPNAMHCKAQRRDGEEGSDMQSLALGYEAYTDCAGGLFPALALFYQRDELIELDGIDIRHRRQFEIPLFPENHAIAVA